MAWFVSYGHPHFFRGLKGKYLAFQASEKGKRKLRKITELASPYYLTQQLTFTLASSVFKKELLCKRGLCQIRNFDFLSLFNFMSLSSLHDIQSPSVNFCRVWLSDALFYFLDSSIWTFLDPSLWAIWGFQRGIFSGALYLDIRIINFPFCFNNNEKDYLDPLLFPFQLWVFVCFYRFNNILTYRE